MVLGVGQFQHFENLFIIYRAKFYKPFNELKFKESSIFFTAAHFLKTESNKFELFLVFSFSMAVFNLSSLRQQKRNASKLSQPSTNFLKPKPSNELANLVLRIKPSLIDQSKLFLT